MPGGGLICLTKYGSENVKFNGNPNMTYFNKVFRQYTPFSLESVTLPFTGPSDLFYDRSIDIRCKIQRVADLVSDAYFVFELPDIYSKYVDKAVRAQQYNFAWVNYIGASIIDRVIFTVGGVKIQEFDGSYLVAKAHADYNQHKLDKWKKLVGEVPELTSPELGLYGGGSDIVGYGYPNVYSNGNEGVVANSPSIPRRTIRVPLPFWFTEDFSLALPLISMQYTECEVQIQLRPIQDLYTVLDPSGSRVRPGFKLVSMNGGNNQEYTVDESLPEFREFLVDISGSVPPNNLLSLRPRLELTYVYISKSEQEVFASTPLSYLVTQVTRFNHTAIYNRQQLDLEAHNLGKRIIILPRRTDGMEYRNAWYNFTNWWAYPEKPYSPTPNLPTYVNLLYSSGVSVPQSQVDIIRGMRFLVDGNEIQEEKDTAFFSDVIPYKYMEGPGLPGMCVQNFELFNDATQPAGTINFSLTRNFQAEIDVYPLPTSPNYLYDLTFYVETLNHFKVTAGLGGLAYAL